jgi:4-hydroxy-tetrahydrodipicolinate reductase
MSESMNVPAITVSVIGAAGRMGSTVCRTVEAAPDTKLVGRYDVGDDLGDLGGADVVVEFSVPGSAAGNVAHCIDRGRHVVVGTTGWTQDSLAQVSSQLAGKPGVGVLIAPNFAIGAILMMSFAQQAARFYESVEIVELHHPDKVDAPSGTALLLGEAAAAGRKVALDQHSARGRDGITGARRTGDIGFASLRGGTVTGDHTVIFAGPMERIELTHRAEDRTMFAQGAVKAALWARDKKPGMYSMADVLGLSDF